MRLVFYYTHARNVSPEDLMSDGITFMFQKMIETGIISECLCIIDSFNLKPKYLKTSKHITCAVVNGINGTEDMICENDIIFIRGGFKPWIPLIERLRVKNHWIIFYGANTGNERWGLWDIVLDDMSGQTKINENGSLNLEYFKPVNEDIFHNTNQERLYDVMIGASHIHDKKGQWKVIDAIIEYEVKYKQKLRCVLTGAFRGGAETARIHQKIIANKLDVKITGMLSRPELAKIYNASKLLIKMGGGQNDRSVLEAMACGCLVNMEVPERSAPLTRYRCLNSEGSIVLILKGLRVVNPDTVSHKTMSDEFSKLSGMSEIVLPRMKKLFNFFKKYPKANRTKLIELEAEHESKTV